jgi:hypothetical protein
MNQTLVSCLKQLERLSGHAPPESTIVITDDSSVTKEFVAISDIDNSRAYLHSYFFNLTQDEQIFILHHQLYSQIADKNRDVAASLRSTFSFAQAHSLQHTKLDGKPLSLRDLPLIIADLNNLDEAIQAVLLDIDKLS